LLTVHLAPVGLCWMVVFLLWLGFQASSLPMSNSTWPGPVSENYSISPAGSGRSPFQDNARHHIHNRQTGAMLDFGQKRTIGIAALVAEPGCDLILAAPDSARTFEL
jgi:hypothetical protein